jgi:transposase
MKRERIEDEISELKRISRRLKIAVCKLLHKNGWTVEQIAKELRIPSSTAWRWATGYDEKMRINHIRSVGVASKGTNQNV